MEEADSTERTNGSQAAKRWMSLQETVGTGVSNRMQGNIILYICWHLGSHSTILLS